MPGAEPGNEAVRTSGGVPLTDELLDRLADEAEASYDLRRLRARLPRRGPLNDDLGWRRSGA